MSDRPPPPTDPFSEIHYPPELPISQRREEIVSAIQRHQTIVLTGETGSGKTTQIPKMCLDAGLGRNGKRIACTQPRRVAALSVAKRVAEELKVDFGAEVGAKIRFTDQTSKRTRVKFMTDGMLLTEIHNDPLMREYDAIIVDEAHERSLNIDFLLGHLNQLRARRPDLKIVITSATIDTDKFSQSFDGAPIIEVSGRVYPVEVIYAPLDELLEESGDFTYLEGIAESTQRIQDEFGQGDILAFLPTEKDIREAMELLEGRFGRRMEIIPCFGRLSNADQQRIFQTSPKRKLILATNIAETSLTIPGIRFVIDAGLARISRYNPRARTQRLPIVKISQSSANQRKGRCGRVADGICIRLYSEKDFQSRPVYSVPEIQRSNLADVILRMIASRLGDIETFPFIDPPIPASISAGYQLLEELGALGDSSAESVTSKATLKEQRDETISNLKSQIPDAPRRLTPTGRQLARLPVDPTVGRMLLEAQRHDVSEQVIVIASALSIQDPRERPMDKEAAARQAHARFDHPHSDFLTLLKIWDATHDELERLSQSKLRKFCKSHFLNYLRMREWRDIYDQLHRALPKRQTEQDRKPQPQSPTPKTQDLERDSAPYQAIHCSLLTGLLANVGRREDVNLYRFSANRKPLVFPGSALFIRQSTDKKSKRQSSPTDGAPKRKSPEWILAAELVETSRLFARSVAAIDPDWIVQVGSHILQRSYSDPEFLPKDGRVVARESVRIHGLEIQSRKVSYLKVDARKATDIFIREALLNEDYEAPANWTFLEDNRRLMRRIQNAQTVVSVAHWMGVEEAAFRFYQSRLENIASIHDLNRFLKGRSELARETQPTPKPTGSKSPLPGAADLTPSTQHPVPSTQNPLILSESDLLRSDSESIDLSLFPETVQLENSALPIEYQYKHGHEKDGVTLKLPYHKAKSVSDALLDWLVPGHLEAKIHALLKALPKPIRQQLHPIAETAKSISKTIRPTGKTLIESLSQHLKTAYSIETYNSDWDPSVIPDHLRARVEVIDKSGKPIAEARDADTLRAQLAEREKELSSAQADDTAALWRRARDTYERPIDSLADLRAALAKTKTATKILIGDLHGVPLHAHPALRSAHPAPRTQHPAPNLHHPAPNLHLSLFSTLEDAVAANLHGIAALIEHELRRDLAWIQTDLKDVQRVGPAGVAFRPIPKLKEDVYEHIRLTLCTHDLTTLDLPAIATAVVTARAQSKGILYRVVDQLKTILEKRQSLIVQPQIAKAYAADIDRLLPPDFLRHTPHNILPRLPVYLEVIAHRAKTAAQNPARDAQRHRQLDHYRQRYAQISNSRSLPSNATLETPSGETISDSPQHPEPRTQNLRWLIEEFAISLFAQHLGTAQPISEKKLDQAFAQLGATSVAIQKTNTSPNRALSTSSTRHPPHEARNPHATAVPDSSHHNSPNPDKPTQADLDSLKKLFG